MRICGVVGARQPGEKDTLSGGVSEFLQKLEGRIGAIHLIDSDGTYTITRPARTGHLAKGTSISRALRLSSWPCRESPGGVSICASGRGLGTWWRAAASSWQICCKAPLWQCPVSLARSHLKLRPILHCDPDRMKRPWPGALRLEAEHVLAMHLFAYELNRLLQCVLLQETQRAPAGGLGEQAGEIRLAQPGQLTDGIDPTARPHIGRNRGVIGSRAGSAFLDLDSFRLGFQIPAGVAPALLPVWVLSHHRLGDQV